MYYTVCINIMGQFRFTTLHHNINSNGIYHCIYFFGLNQIKYNIGIKPILPSINWPKHISKRYYLTMDPDSKLISLSLFFSDYC